MSGLPTLLLLLLFAASAAVIWGAGVKLSDYTDVLAQRLHLGEALGGLILLAVATNLPEIAITVSAAAAGHVEVAVGNILGGIAIQTVVLVAVDAFGVDRRRPLTYVAGSLTLVLEALLVAAVLSLVVAGAQLPPSVERFRVEPGPLLEIPRQAQDHLVEHLDMTFLERRLLLDEQIRHPPQGLDPAHGVFAGDRFFDLTHEGEHGGHAERPGSEL